MLTLEQLKEKRFAVIGLGMTGCSCVDFLYQNNAQVYAFDTRSPHPVNISSNVTVAFGELNPDVLSTMDLLVVSPGIPLSHPAIAQAIAAGVRAIGDVELFSWFNQKPVIAITGSNGKSTVTSLVCSMLKSAGFNAKMGGNIGIPVLSLLSEPYDIAVLELSSFQLETTHSLKPQAATVLNVSADHLDRYESFEAYRQAKLRIYQNAQVSVINDYDRLTIPHTGDYSESFGKEGAFTISDDGHSLLFKGEAWLDYRQCKLTGKHNALNIQAAAALCHSLGVALNKLTEGAMQFEALPHRCQRVSRYNDIQWIDDSKATNVGAAQTAIESLSWGSEGRMILIAGGDAKGADLTVLKPYLEQYVSAMIVLGKDANQLLPLHTNTYRVGDMKEAVQVAATLAQKNDIVLLSPACASIDMFANYMERGKQFLQAVEALQ